VLPCASWQRCRPHYYYSRNLATKVPKSAQPWVATLMRATFEQPDAVSVRAQHAQVVTALEAKFPQATSTSMMPATTSWRSPPSPRDLAPGVERS
jgi:transposase-like protein